MKTLTVEVLAEPETLAEWCVRQGHVAWGERNCCPFPAAECPLHPIPECRDVMPEHWEKVLKEESDGMEVPSVEHPAP